MSDQTKLILVQGDLSTRGGLNAAITAAAILGKALTASIHQAKAEKKE